MIYLNPGSFEQALEHIYNSGRADASASWRPVAIALGLMAVERAKKEHAAFPWAWAFHHLCEAPYNLDPQMAEICLAAVGVHP